MRRIRATIFPALLLAAAVSFGGAFGTGPAHAITFTLQDVSYDWTGTVGGTNVVENNNVPPNAREEIRWGVPSGQPNQSGLGIEKSFGAFGALPFNVNPNQNFPLGLFTHFNFEITQGSAASSAFLDVTPTILADGSPISVGTFSFRFDIEETDNAPPCPAFQQSSTNCDDRITPSTAIDNSFEVDGTLYTISIFGFCATCTGESPQGNFITEEGGARTAFLVARITEVPEPGTLAVVAVGLLGLAAVRRRRG